MKTVRTFSETIENVEYISFEGAFARLDICGVMNYKSVRISELLDIC